MSNIKVWSEGTLLYVDIEVHGIRPQFIDIQHEITFTKSVGNDVYIETTGGNFFLLNANDHQITCLIHESRINRLRGKEE